MTRQSLTSIRPRIEEVLRQHAVPGVVIAVAREGHPLDHLAVGTDARGQALAPDSLFPVASITKLATALSVLRLVDAEALHYEDRLSDYLPESAAASAGVTLRMLFTHTAGLQGMDDEIVPWNRAFTWSLIMEATLRSAPDVSPGAHVAYSDVDYLLLAMVVERLTGQAFPAACRQLVLDPLGIEAYLGEEPPRPPAYVADESHAGTEVEWHNSAFFRAQGLPSGGLVTTAAGALALVRAYAGVPDGFLRPDTRAAATRDQTGGVGGSYFAAIHEQAEFAGFPWGLGPELRGDRNPHFASAQAHPTSFGHAGASGCLTWADPSADIAWSILGTRHLRSGWGEPGLGSISAAILA